MKVHLPNLSSPKFPQPIFFPTLKLGPTIRYPELLVDTLCLEECMVELLLGGLEGLAVGPTRWLVVRSTVSSLCVFFPSLVAFCIISHH